jgi:hypothetical protein
MKQLRKDPRVPCRVMDPKRTDVLSGVSVEDEEGYLSSLF